MTFKKRQRRRGGRRPSNLSELHRGEQGVLERIDLPQDAGRRLMELGFVPGSLVVAAGCGPGGDPRIFRVDGSEVALRRETAAFLKLRHSSPSAD